MRPAKSAPCFLALALATAVAAPLCRAQEDDPPTINAGRPDFTENATVVEENVFQIESGVLYQRGQGVRSTDGPELQLRYGLPRKMEAQLALPNYTRIKPGGPSGFGDGLAGLKYQIGPVNGWDMAVAGAVSLPVGESDFSSGSFDPSALFTWARDVSGDDNVAGTFSVAWPNAGGGGGRDTLYGATLELTHGFNWRSAAFAEYAGSFQQGGDDSHLLHFGYKYLPNRKEQWDLHFGFGLNDASPDFLLGGGFSHQF
jgi:hypothetical protein